MQGDDLELVVVDQPDRRAVDLDVVDDRLTLVVAYLVRLLVLLPVGDEDAGGENDSDDQDGGDQFVIHANSSLYSLDGQLRSIWLKLKVSRTCHSSWLS
ncbi:hypothetical protein C4566_01200 [Candidatus Parcubacteria bacterium]|nr:MAG: hypothetical protein C4566_01200 [Candidatus Parcubacteria bacterium]